MNQSLPNIIVCPKLESTGADAEHTREKLFRLKKRRDVEILCKVRKLLSEVSRLLKTQDDGL